MKSPMLVIKKTSYNHSPMITKIQNDMQSQEFAKRSYKAMVVVFV